MRYELYFCLRLTENEHYIVEQAIINTCKNFDCKLLYYRKLKDGHVPLYREVKLVGKDIARVWRILKDKHEFDKFVKDNPHRKKIYYSEETAGLI